MTSADARVSAIVARLPATSLAVAMPVGLKVTGSVPVPMNAARLLVVFVRVSDADFWRFNSSGLKKTVSGPMKS